MSKQVNNIQLKLANEVTQKQQLKTDILSRQNV